MQTAVEVRLAVLRGTARAGAYVKQLAVAHKLGCLGKVSRRLRPRCRVAVRRRTEQRTNRTRLGDGMDHGAERLVRLLADEAVGLARLLDEHRHDEVEVRLHLMPKVRKELTEAHDGILGECRTQRVGIPNEQQVDRVQLGDEAAV